MSFYEFGWVRKKSDREDSRERGFSLSAKGVRALAGGREFYLDLANFISR